MSYSFSIKADSKREATEQVITKVHQIVQDQPVHAADLWSAANVACAFIGTLVEPGPLEQITLQMNGYVSWRAEKEFTGANVSVSAAVVSKV